MVKLIRTSAVAIAATSIALVFSSAAPAGAVRTRPSAPRSITIHYGVGNATSPNFAGYFATATAITSATSKFKVPTLTSCTASGPTSTDGFGLGVSLNNTAQTEFTDGLVFAICNGATPVYVVDVLIDDNDVQGAITLNPGDKVTSTITESAAAGTTVTVADTTAHSSITVSDAGVKMTQAIIGDFALNNGTSTLGIPNFGSMTFKGAKLNGTALQTAAPTATDMNDGTNTQITTGAFITSTSFKTTWAHE